MVQGVMRVALVAVWLAVGVVLLFRRDVLPAEWVAGKNAATMNLMGFFALLLAAYNALRLVVGIRRRRARRAAVNPLSRPRPTPTEYNPELDFTGTGPPPTGEAKADGG